MREENYLVAPIMEARPSYWALCFLLEAAISLQVYCTVRMSLSCPTRLELSFMSVSSITPALCKYDTRGLNNTKHEEIISYVTGIHNE